MKRVALYQAETKGIKMVALKVADFKSPEEMAAYIEKLKKDNKEKNRIFKENKIRARIESAVKKTGDLPEAVKKDEPIAEPIAKPIADPKPAVATPELEVSAAIDISLHPDTGNTIAIYGASKKGKTTLMMHLYDKYFSGDRDYISTLFSGNPQLKIYKDKKLLIGYGFTPRSAKYIQLQQYLNVKTKNHYKFLNLFDDIVDAKYSSIINKLVCTYRNSNISTIVCLQYVYMLSKANRGSVNHTMVFGANTSEDAKELINTLLRPYLVDLGLKSFNDQMKFYRQVTADHGFFYIDNIKNKMSLHRLSL